MHLFKYLSSPTSPDRTKSHLYQQENGSPESSPIEPSPHEQQNHQKPNFLNLSGKKLLSLLTPTKSSKHEKKRADTPIPAALPPVPPERKSTSAGSCFIGKKLGRTEAMERLRVSLNVSRGARRAQSSGITRRKLTFPSRRMEASANTSVGKRWCPAMEIIPEENEEREESEGKE